MHHLLKISVLLLCIYAKPAIAQQAPIEAFLGIWKGTLEIFGAEGKKNEIPMELHILKTDSAGKYTWKILYGELPRDYVLYTKNIKKGLYVVDEQNGILIEEVLFGETLQSCFEVEGNLLTSSYRLESKKLIFEIFFYPKKEAYKTGNLPEKQVPEVISYKPTTMQRAVLSKKRN